MERENHVNINKQRLPEVQENETKSKFANNMFKSLFMTK